MRERGSVGMRRQAGWVLGVAFGLVVMASCAETEIKPFDQRSHGGGATAGVPGGADQIKQGTSNLGSIDTKSETLGECVRSKVSFTGSRGDKVPGYLFVPASGESKKLPAVMLLYGIVGDKDSTKISDFAGMLCAKKFAVMTFDVPGRGERSGAADSNPAVTAIDPNLLRWYIADYGAALSFMATLPQIDPARIGLAGASWGAISGIVFAAKDPRVRAVVSVVGGGGFQSLLAMVGLSSPDLDPVNAIRLIPPRPIMLINGRRDEVILAPFSQALHDAAPTATKVWLDCNHTLDDVDLKTVAGQVADWLVTNLR